MGVYRGQILINKDLALASVGRLARPHNQSKGLQLPVLPTMSVDKEKRVGCSIHYPL